MSTVHAPFKVKLQDGSRVTIVDEDGNIDAPVTTTNLTTTGNTTLGDASADTVTINGTVTANAPITVGVDDTGYDVKFFGATSGKSLLWDESADSLIVTGLLQMGEGENVALGTTTGTKIGTAATQKVAFYNATPVVQPATTGTTTGFTAGSGTAVLDDSTFTGDTGSAAYTVGDVVKALKDLGLLAA